MEEHLTDTDIYHIEKLVSFIAQQYPFLSESVAKNKTENYIGYCTTVSKSSLVRTKTKKKAQQLLRRTIEELFKIAKTLCTSEYATVVATHLLYNHGVKRARFIPLYYFVITNQIVKAIDSVPKYLTRSGLTLPPVRIARNWDRHLLQNNTYPNKKDKDNEYKNRRDAFTC